MHGNTAAVCLADNGLHRPPHSAVHSVDKQKQTRQLGASFTADVLTASQTSAQSSCLGSTAQQLSHPRSTLQVPSQPPGIHNFPHPSRHPRRARASRLAPHPANSTAHVPETASTAVPAPDVASRQSDDATAQSQDHSQQRAGPAMSASAEAQTCAGQEVNGHAQGEGDAAALVQPREGTPVSSNRRHYRVCLWWLACCSFLTPTWWQTNSDVVCCGS